MAAIGIDVKMSPSHPGDFIRAEIPRGIGSQCHEGFRDSTCPKSNAFRTAE